MQPEIELGPLTLQTFGLMFGLAFIAAGWLLWKRFEELGRVPDWSYEMAFVAALGGLAGSRINYLIEHWDEVADDLLGSLFSGSGLTWYGGAIGGAIAVLLWARWRKILGVGLLDLAAAPLALGYAIGRIGCQLSGDGDYGKEWDGPWAMSYEDGTVPTPPGVEVHPTPIYEMLAMGTAAFVLWRLRDRFAVGVLFGIYLLIAGLERFLVEFIRRNDDLALGLTEAQLLSVLMVLGGVAMIAARRKRPLPARRAERL